MRCAVGDKTFNRLLYIITALGIISMIAIVAWSWFLYKDCSIISYIANKG